MGASGARACALKLDRKLHVRFVDALAVLEQLLGALTGDRSQYKEPDEVAEAVVHALFDANPKRRYMVVPNEREAEITIRKAIEELVQLNEGHQFTYDRASLIAMLDEALAATRR